MGISIPVNVLKPYKNLADILNPLEARSNLGLGESDTPAFAGMRNLTDGAELYWLSNSLIFSSLAEDKFAFDNNSFLLRSNGELGWRDAGILGATTDLKVKRAQANTLGIYQADGVTRGNLHVGVVESQGGVLGGDNWLGYGGSVSYFSGDVIFRDRTSGYVERGRINANTGTITATKFQLSNGGMETGVDPANPATNSLFILPPSSGDRIYLGKSGYSCYALNLSNVSNLENVPPFLCQDGTNFGLQAGASFNVGRGEDSLCYIASAPTNAHHRWYTGTAYGGTVGGATEKMRLTREGNLLLGTTTHDGYSKFQVNGAITASGDVTLAYGKQIEADFVACKNQFILGAGVNKAVVRTSSPDAVDIRNAANSAAGNLNVGSVTANGDVKSVNGSLSAELVAGETLQFRGLFGGSTAISRASLISGYFSGSAVGDLCVRSDDYGKMMRFGDGTGQKASIDLASGSITTSGAITASGDINLTSGSSGASISSDSAGLILSANLGTGKRVTQGSGQFTTTLSASDFTSSVPIIANSRVSSAVALTAKGAASQSANLQEWQDNLGTVLAAISASGGLGLWGVLPPVSQPAAIADATDLASVISGFNSLLAAARSYGWIAT